MPRRFAARDDGGGPSNASAREPARIAANKHRRVQAVRTGGRKLFDEAAQAAFFEWFAATANLAWSAEMAGFNYKTVLRHRMNDERFAEAYDRALAQAYARVEAKRLETKKREAPIGIEGDRDAPEMDEMSPERMDAILRDRDRALARGGAGSERRRQGKRPRIASNAEVREALIKRLRAYRERVLAEDAPRDGDVAADGADGGGPEADPAPKTNDIIGSPAPLPHEQADNAPHCPDRPGGPGDRLISDGPPPRTGEDI